MKKYLIYIIPVLVLTTACQHEPLYTPVNVEDPNGNGNGNGNNNGESCDEDIVYFVNDVLPILTSNCAISGCHGGGSAQDGVNLSNYAGIREQLEAFDANNSELYEVITEDDPDKIMPPPPNSPLTAQQIATIRDWINQGAENNECTNTSCDLTNVTYSQSVWPIIQNSCTGCHSGGNPQGGISLTNYSQIAVMAENGSLSSVINHAPGYTPMPLNGQQLDQCSIDTIDDWINNGFQND